ncbi:MAG: Lrp/AsnC family transcriptional regulator [Spirochaetaceae bacterium]
MDKVDKNILRLLQSNARISASDIAKEVNLSVSAVSERLRKLETSKVIQKYTAILDPVKLEKELSAFMLISLKNPQTSHTFLDFIDDEDDVLSCSYISGEFDYMIKIITKNTDTLTKVLNRIKSVDGVDKTNTMVILNSEKDNQTYLI